MENTMLKYQIQFVDSTGCGSYDYFEADTQEQALELAVETANNHLKQKYHWQRINPPMFFESRYKPVRTPKVVEIVAVKGSEEVYTSRDGTQKTRYKWITKRGGHKFKLTLNYIEYKFKDGSSERNVWYVIKK